MYNAAGMAKNFPDTILYGLLDYQDIGVKNPFFLQEIIHIITFLNEVVCNSFTSELLQSNAEFSGLKLVSLSLSPPSTTMRKSTLPICPQGGTRIFGDSCQICYSS